MKKFLVLFSAALLTSGIHAQTWTPLSVGNSADVSDISFPADDTGFASLSNGTMRKTFDGGLNWTNVSLPFAYTGTVEFLSGSTGMILQDSMILRTANCGASWSVVFTDAEVLFNDVSFVSNTIGYAAGTNGITYDTFNIYKTLDAGLTWSPCTPIHDWLAGGPILHFRTPLEGYLTGSDSIYRTADGGVTWSSVFASNNNAMVTTVCAADANTTYACDMDNFEVSKSINGGITWSGTSQSMASITYGSHFFNANFGFMCGGNGINAGFISQTLNGGTSWTSPYMGTSTMLNMDFPSATTGYCGGTGGVIMKYTGPLSIQDKAASEIGIYPNPATDFVFIQNAEVESTITITNSLGEMVKTETILGNNIRIDVSDLAEGIYFCTVISGETVWSEKLVVE